MAKLSVQAVLRDMERQAKSLDKMADDLERTAKSLKGAHHEAVMREVWGRRSEASTLRLIALQIRADHNL